MIFDSVVASHDWTDVSKRLLKTLEFRLSDAYGRTIDFHKIPVVETGVVGPIHHFPP